MCAVTLLVSYVKRIAYLFDDEKFAPVYDYMKANYFRGRDSAKEPIQLFDGGGGLLGRISAMILKLRSRVKELEHNTDPVKNVPMVLTLDHCHNELREAVEILIEADPADLTATGTEREKNARTLSDLKRLCNVN
jgi:hypothetical protein